MTTFVNLRFNFQFSLLLTLSLLMMQCASYQSRATDFQKGLSDDPELSTFNELVQKAGGMEELLAVSSIDKHTFFVPNNEAFDQLGQKLIDNFSLEKNRDVLLGVLRSHVTAGQYSASEAEENSTPIISLFDTNISLPNNSAKLLYSIKTREGVIHVIDKVIQR